MFTPILLTVFCYAVTTLSAKLGPCKKEDFQCIAKSLNDMQHYVYSGIPSLGIKTLDPMYQKIIEVDLSVLKYKFTDTTITGFKDCTVKDVNLNLDALKMSYVMECPKLVMSGTYEINGKLIIMDVEGKGPYEIVTGRYSIPTEIDLKIINDNDGKSYLSLKDFKVKPEALEPIKFDFKNLFNGDETLADAVLKFAHENWKDVSNFVQEPILKQDFKTIFINYNKFLKTQPLNEIFIN